MTKKKKIIIIVTIFITLGIIFLVLWKNNLIFSSKETNTLIPIKDKDKNTQTKDVEIDKKSEEYIEKNEKTGSIIDKDTNKVIYDPNEQYDTYPLPETPKVNMVTAADAAEIAEYTKYFFYLYQPQPVSSSKAFIIDKFSDEDIAAIVALASRMYEPRTEKEIQEIAKRYFNIDNYKLPLGTYNIKNYGKFTVTEINNKYIWSGIKEKIEQVKTIYINKLEINDNKIILFLDEANDTFIMGYPGCYSPIDPKNECISGFFKIHLTYISDKVLTVDKIEYTPNPNYIEPKE